MQRPLILNSTMIRNLKIPPMVAMIRWDQIAVIQTQGQFPLFLFHNSDILPFCCISTACTTFAEAYFDHILDGTGKSKEKGKGKTKAVMKTVGQSAKPKAPAKDGALLLSFHDSTSNLTIQPQ